ncbi:MAG: 2'-5' RNA ligase family protein [archaeon]|nr:2'-5' RNA ligase family protein [archaeon]
MTGETKYYLKNLIYEISKKFRVKGITRKHVVPHVTLFGPFSCNNEKELILRFLKVCKSYDLPAYELEGFGNFDDKVIHVNIAPSDELKSLRADLADSLIEICNSVQEYDHASKDEYKFHSTLAFKDINGKFYKIMNYLDSRAPPHKKEYALRITLLKKGKILREYDIMQRNLLRRDEALSKRGWHQTKKSLNEILDNNGKRLLPEIKTSEDVWLISDLHFDHENIIRYCKRPFKNKEEMNKILLENWNNTVKDNDLVLFLGDMTFGRGRHSAEYWIKQLKGKIYFIKGNHEEVHYDKAYNQAILDYGGEKFFLIHDPALVQKDWKCWVIHGHKHNNQLDEFPLINNKNKTINVSCELTDYSPIRLSKILEQRR